MIEDMKKEKTEVVYDNEMVLIFDAIGCNEALARMTVMAFLTPLNPTMEEIADVKTAVSEAVTNSIIHGYGGKEGKIHMLCRIQNHTLFVEISDEGVGISDIAKAMEPTYTTRPELERSGMGFCFMEAFMDELCVESEVGKGTVVYMTKTIAEYDGQTTD